MIFKTDPNRDVIVGGKIFTADKDGKADIPDDLAQADGLMKAKGQAGPDPEWEALVDKAVSLGVADADGKPIAPSVLTRYKPDRLAKAIEDRLVDIAKAEFAALPPEEQEARRKAGTAP